MIADGSARTIPIDRGKVHSPVCAAALARPAQTAPTPMAMKSSATVHALRREQAPLAAANRARAILVRRIINAPLCRSGDEVELGDNQ
jgi:hypothetical protein